MSQHEFIFTKTVPERYYRHILFWLMRILAKLFFISDIFFTNKSWYVVGELLLNILNTGLEICYTYLVVYYLVPKYFNREPKSKFIVFIVAVTIVNYALTFATYSIVYDFKDLSFDSIMLNMWRFFFNMIAGGSPVICCLFLSGKILKDYFLRLDEKSILLQETADAELQVLKAQVHPHFLFNTLNNIYSFILTKSVHANELVLKLSDTLRYMIKDCDAPLVPLKLELKMLEDYMGLEKVRYGDRLQLEIVINGNLSDQYITPLLLIPFVENCFKHGASKMLGHAWIRLHISVKDDLLTMELSNSKEDIKRIHTQKSGIGLRNIKKRLAILYPTKHQLTHIEKENYYSVLLQVPLQKTTESDSTIIPEIALMGT